MIKVLLLIVLLLPSAVHAYDCRTPSRLSADIANADVVFAGRVQDVQRMGVAFNELGTERVKVHFAPYVVWKGAVDSQRIVVDTESLYGYSFEQDDLYLVLGYRLYDDRISMVGCPRSEPLTGELLQRINKIVEPIAQLEALPRALLQQKESADE